MGRWCAPQWQVQLGLRMILQQQRRHLELLLAVHSMTNMILCRLLWQAHNITLCQVDHLSPQRISPKRLRMHLATLRSCTATTTSILVTHISTR